MLPQHVLLFIIKGLQDPTLVHFREEGSPMKTSQGPCLMEWMPVTLEPSLYGVSHSELYLQD